MAKLAEPPPQSSGTYATTKVQPPVNLNNWIEENRHLFKPPVSNRYLYDGRDFFVMVIAGPNARNDFHQVDSEEYFYQLKGDIKVRIREGDRIAIIRAEGEPFFSANIVPQYPRRPTPLASWSSVAVRRRERALIFSAQIARRWWETSSSMRDTSSILASISISGATKRGAPAKVRPKVPKPER